MERNRGRLIRVLQEGGWVDVATKGSPCQFKHPAKMDRATVPDWSMGFPRGTAASVYRQAGWNT